MEHKVILLSGSPREGGNTEQVLTACAEELKNSGLQPEIISLRGKSIGSCNACGHCNSTGRCALGDGANDIFDKIKEARGLIVGAPVYYGTARGDVMCFLQRLGMISARNGRFLDGMVGGPIAVARRGGHTATIQELLMFSFICGMIVPGSDYWNMVFGRDKGECQEDVEGMGTARLFAVNVAKVIHALYG
ncbi:MAG: flavodoxin family protein [Clostridiales bacterium]|nr:flavodoxin family protein [Clostridiales bacterium]